MANVPDVALITLFVDLRTVAPVQTPERSRDTGSGCSQDQDSHLKRHC